MATELPAWLGVIEQLATPAALVVPMQVWAVGPVPMVKTTVRPAMGPAPSSRSTPDRVVATPLSK